MTFDNIINAPCLIPRRGPNCAPAVITPGNGEPPPTGNCCAKPDFQQANPTVCNQDDLQCADSTFAQNNPTICPNSGRIILKPEFAIKESNGQVIYRAYLLANGEESELSGVVFSTSNAGVATIGGVSGNATAFLEGIATISATWQGLTAFGQMRVVANCSTTQSIFAVVIDNSESMGQLFSPMFATKLEFAKEQASRLIDTMDLTKDSVAIFSFTGDTVKVLSASQNADTLKNSIQSIAIQAAKTNINGAVGTAVTYVGRPEFNGLFKTMIVFSDGENIFGGNPLPTAAAFRNQGGVMMVVGCRAHDGGFTLLDHMASGGYFINAHSDNEASVPDWLSGLKGYICSGNCNPAGGVTVGYGALNFNGFTKWDVINHVDLIGSNGTFPLFDILPGHGLYVDMAGSSASFQGGLVSKEDFRFITGRTYRIVMQLAGNNRCEHDPSDPYEITVKIGDGTIFTGTATITNWLQPFTTYIFTFNGTQPLAEDIPPGEIGGEDGGEFGGEGGGEIGEEGGGPGSERHKLSIQQTAHAIGCPESFGIPLDDVFLLESQSGDFTDGVVMLQDDFNGENPVTFAPNCKNDLSMYGYAGDYCPSTGCLDTPIPAQVPDPNPLTKIEVC